MQTFAREECRVEIGRRLRMVRADSVRRWGSMTAHQMICHCADACRMALGDVVPRDVSTAATRHLVKWIALYAPMRWPGGVQTVEEFDQRKGGTCPTDFAADLAALEQLLERIRPRGEAWARHPIFGPLSERAWLRWAYLHMDHHLRQFGV